ncbi:MAG: phosphoglucomutase/phosphomannomutase family protein [Saprospiraceae bacterium]|nr:phosphoglucomutase/phosphomannomutase family protein [Saprospiraceae bacterium]
MTNIKFGTDGWRAIIAKDYTIDNVKRVAEGTAHWLKKNNGNQVVIGYDCRFGGLMFSEVTAQVLGGFGIKVLLDKNFTTTPMVSLGVAKTHSDLGVVITASHNPPSYNGYKLKSKFGGPMVPTNIAEVEAEIPEVCSLESLPSLQELEEKGLLEYPDLEALYLDHVAANFDLDSIRQSDIVLAYDAMYGAGQNAVKKLFPDAHFLHCEYNPSFMGQAPEPIHRNLGALSQLIQDTPSINMGLANDGDADRIGLYDEDGKFVDSHHILLLLLLYMRAYKKQSGKVIITFSVTDKMAKLADHFGLAYEVTKIGFKYIAEIMTQDDVIVGGEESGGLAVKGHIPERDGIWIGLMIIEFMAKTGKSIKQLIQDVYAIVGPFHSDRDDLHITQEQKMRVVQTCQDDPYQAFGPYRVQKVEKIDGTKFWLADDKWVMIRPSGTEPVLRVYSQAPDAAEVRKILDATREAIL